MKVSVSVFGRLHAFYLADQLHQRNALHHLYTTYPKFEVVKYRIPRDLIKSFPALEIAFRGYMALPGTIRRSDTALIGFPALYDRLVSRAMEPGFDAFHGWSQSAEHSLIRARSFGALATLQRGSAHIQYQRDILVEESEITGVKCQLPPANIVEREKREYAIADCVFVPSEFARQSFITQGFPDARIRKVPLGVSLDQFYETPKNDDVFRVVYAGAMSLQKGVHYLLQAFSELRLPHAELWLVGQMQPEMEKFFRRFEGCYTYLGKVPQSRLRDIYGQCSAFALCSIQDGFGVVLTQAMACGLPVVCSTNTGGPDILTNGREGFIVSIRDVEALKQHILFLYEHPDVRREMGQQARSRASAALGWDDYGSNMAQAFEQLVSAKRNAFGPESTVAGTPSQ